MLDVVASGDQFLRSDPTQSIQPSQSNPVNPIQSNQIPFGPTLQRHKQ